MPHFTLLFPGQGSQEAGMGRELAESDREAMELWKKAEHISGIALRGIYWDGDESGMADTRNLQPAMTVVNLNLWRLLSAKMSPGAAAGHSLGEFSALAAAGVLPFETTIELVSLRGRLMSQADPQGKGTMAAVVRLSLAQVEDCVAEARADGGETLVIANHNTPSQFVVSGGAAAIAKIQEKVRTARGRAMPLPVSGAFHSPLMAEAAAEFAKALDGVTKNAWSKARFPVYANVSARAQTDPAALKELLSRQMVSPVYWSETIARIWDEGGAHFVECGPKGVLSKMIDPILHNHAPAMAAHSGERPAWKAVSVSDLRSLREFSQEIGAKNDA